MNVHSSSRRAFRRFVLTSTIAPASLITSSFAADVFLPPNQTLDSDAGANVYFEGLEEGRLNGNADNEATPNPKNSTPELTLRMGQLNQNGDGDIPDGWAANSTWVYTGQIQISSSFLAFAMNNDDNDWLKINGVVVLDDNGWNTPIQADSNGNGNNVDGGAPAGGDSNLVAGLGLTVGEWYDVEFRIGNGGGGAGPSGQTAGWNATYGIGMNTTGLMADNTTPLGTSVNGADYIKPTEPAGGGATLFRYLVGSGFEHEYRVTDSATVTIDGNNATTGVTTLRFENAAPATFTLNDGTGAHKTFNVFGNTTLASADNQSVTINGTSDFAPRGLTDGGFTGITVTYDGTGTMSLGAGSVTGLDVDGVTFAVNNGTLALDYSAGSPIGAQPVNITGATATLRVGSGGGATIGTNINATASGTLAHSSTANDTITGAIVIAAGQTLTADISGGSVNISGPVTGNALVKAGNSPLTLNNGANSLGTFGNVAGTTTISNNVTIGQLDAAGGTLNINGTANVTDLSVIGTNVVVNGSLNLTNSPILTGGALRLRNTTSTLPAALTVQPNGTLDIVPGAIGASTLSVNGGTLTLSGASGLNVEFWNTAPNSTGADPDRYNSIWGDVALTQGSTAGGVNTPGNGNFTTFQELYNNTLGAPSATVNSTANGVAAIDFASVTSAPFAALGVNFTDNIQSRWSGFFYAPVEGVYAFDTRSDDGSIIFIDDQNVAYNNRYQGMTTRGGSFFLAEGFHSIVLGHYEGNGGAGFQANVTLPGGTSQLISNSMLSPTNTLPVFTETINIDGSSAINVSGLPATANTVNIDAGFTLTTSGGGLTIGSAGVSAGTTTFDTAAGHTTTINTFNDGSADIDLVKSGAGILVLNAPASPHLQNAGSSITINGGQLGLVLGGANSSTGNAAVIFNGGGVALSSAGGNQSYPLPAVLTGNPSFSAQQIGSGVAGPATITLTGNLATAPGQTVTLSTADNYTLEVGGTASGGGNLVVTGTGVTATNSTAIEGLNVQIGAGPANSSLRVVANSLTIPSLSSVGQGAANLVLGTGAGNAALTINGATNTRYNGTITEAAGNTVSLVKSGTGSLTLGGINSFTGGVTVSDGTLEIRNSFDGNAIGSNTVNLAGGTLQFITKGLNGQFYDGNDGGANLAFTTFASYSNYFATRTAPSVTASTDIPQHPTLNFPSADEADPPAAGSLERNFRNYGFASFNNIVSRMSGRILIEQEGNYTFRTTSDDGSMLYVDGATVVDNNFYQGMTAREGSLFLTAGYHDIDIGFYEGGGGNGLIVDWQGPGFGFQNLPNTVLENFDYSDTDNAINLTVSSTIDARGATVNLGAITMGTGATLSTTAGIVNFTQTNLPGAGTFAYDNAGSLNTGQINDAGSAVIINKAGAGNLTLNGANPQLTNAANVINVTGGRLVAVGGANNPLGSSTINLNGGSLGLSSSNGAANFDNPINVLQSTSIDAANFGGGAIDGQTSQINSALTVAAGQTLTAESSHGYTLRFGNSVSGAGGLLVDGGTVEAVGGVSVNSLVIDGGSLRAANSVASTTGTAVNLGGTLVVDNATVTGGVNVDGGTVRAGTGVSDLGDVNFTSPALNRTADALNGRFLATGGEFVPSLFPGNTVAGLNAVETLPAVEVPLQNAQLNFPDDAAFTTYFGGVNTAQRYTAGFFGNFVAPISGTYQAKLEVVDDTAGVWIDLNQNGAFETNGSVGSELISSRGCCGEGPIGSANLIGGETYRFAAAVEDTGGGGSVRVLAALPGGPLTTVEPGVTQPGLWSFDAPTGGGRVEVLGGAELRASSVDGAVSLAVDGTLRLNSVAPSASSVDVLRNSAGGTLTLDAGNDLIADNFTVAQGTTFVKNGAGTLTALAQSIGNGGTLQVDAGLVNLQGNEPLASNGPSASGGVSINGGTVNLSGSIGGSVAINGGVLSGTGTAGGGILLNLGGTLAPGNSPGIITSGNLTLSSGTLSIELNGATAGTGYDQVDVVGSVSITSNTPLNLTLGYDPIDFVDSFTIVNNDGIDAVTLGGVLTVNGTPVNDGAFFDLGGQRFQLEYDGGTDNNDIVLMAIPEPSSITCLLGGLATLAGLQRFRRRRS